MTAVAGERQLDLALFGATGFTGGLTARYLARHAPADLRWALVGRNRAKLEAAREEVERVRAEGASAPELLEADAGDAAALTRVAEAAKVVITTVGPYVFYGEPLVAACAAAGTDYVDLTGEPEFYDRVWLGYHERARASGARIVHCCGFDSIPHDLGAHFTVKQLPEGVPLAVDGYVRAGGSFSGGTFHSAVNAFARARKALGLARRRREAEPRPVGRRVRAAPPRLRRAPGIDGWAVPMPTIDGPVVRHSAMALERYGPDFTYGHNLVVPNLPALAGLVGGIGAMGLLSATPPTRKLLLKVRSPGDGPSEAARAKAWFKVRFVGEGGGERVVTEVSGGDPGYDETAKMLSESALCLAFDELPETAGQVTTAAAMGDALTERLQRAGMGFRVLEPAPAG